MADPSNGITFRSFQEAMPEYHISNSLLDGVLTAMPPPPPGASTAWCQERLTLIIDEVAARVPMDAAQGHLAAQCVLAGVLAEDMAAHLRTPGLSMMERRQVSGTADRLLCTVTRMERALERRQARVLPFRDTKAVDGFDLDALEGVWRRGMLGLVASDPRAPPRAPAKASAVEPPDALEPVVVPDPMKREPIGRDQCGLETAGPEPGLVAMPASARAGDAAGDANGGPDAAWAAATSDGHGGRGRAGVTLEQGDGWSLEVWPARADAGMAAGRAAQDALTDTRAKSGAAMAERSATDRRGTRSGA